MRGHLSFSSLEATWGAEAEVEARSADAEALVLVSMPPLVAEEELAAVSRQIVRLALVSAVGLLLVVLWQRCRQGSQGSLEGSISIAILACDVAQSEIRDRHKAYIPKLCPSYEIWMVHLTLGVDMLSWADHHCFGRRDVYQRRFTRVTVWYPYR